MSYQINLPEPPDNGGEPLGRDLQPAPEGFGKVEDPYTPPWWLARLERALAKRARELRLYEDYYDGSQKLAFATDQFRRAFGLTFRAFSDNWMQIVVDAVEERLNVEGFRIPVSDDAEQETTGDTEAWDLWQANGLDAESQLVHTDALVDGVAYVIVGPGEDGQPEITGESALQVICESEPGYRTKRLAALKKWQDDTDGFAYATLYLPGEIYKFVSSRKVRRNASKTDWIPRLIQGETWPLPNPAAVVPVVPFVNRPRLVGDGRSEIGQLIPLQDAINKLFMDMLVASEYTGFPQRVGTGIELPTDPETGQPVKVDWLKMAVDRMIHTANNEAKFYTLDAADLANYTGAIAMAIQHLASRSSTPPHYFLAHQGNFPSGEALKAAETGLVSKVRRRMRFFGESWEEVIRVAFLMKDDSARAKAALAGETLWADPESRSESEHIDAVVKMGSLRVPVEILWQKSGMFTDTEIARMREMVADGAILASPPSDTGTQAPATTAAPVPPQPASAV